MSNTYIKTPYQIHNDTKLLDSRILKLSDSVIESIRDNAGISSEYTGSIFRPTEDFAMLLFKKSKKSPSEYTINLLTLKPTANSPNKTIVPKNILLE